jgi:hypothetical protein
VELEGSEHVLAALKFERVGHADDGKEILEARL